MLCAFVAGLLYIFQSYLAQLVFPDWQSFADNQDVASSEVMEFIGRDFLDTFFTAAYVAGAFASAMAAQASVARVLFAMGRDGSLPRPVFGKLHPRFRTPVTANLVVGACGLAGARDQPRDRLVDDLLRRAAGLLVREPVGDQDVRPRPGPPERQDLFLFGLIPLVGFGFTIYLWTKLTSLTFEIGLSWLAAGLVLLAILTNGFRKAPPAMYDADDEHLLDGRS